MAWVVGASPELDRQSRWRAITATTLVFTVLMIMVVALRFWIRRRILHKEDWLTLGTMVCEAAEHWLQQLIRGHTVLQHHIQRFGHNPDEIWPRTACSSTARPELAELHVDELCLKTILSLRSCWFQVGAMYQLPPDDER